MLTYIEITAQKCFMYQFEKLSLHNENLTLKKGHISYFIHNVILKIKRSIGCLHLHTTHNSINLCVCLALNTQMILLC